MPFRAKWKENVWIASFSAFETCIKMKINSSTIELKRGEVKKLIKIAHNNAMALVNVSPFNIRVVRKLLSISSEHPEGSYFSIQNWLAPSNRLDSQLSWVVEIARISFLFSMVGKKSKVLRSGVRKVWRQFIVFAWDMLKKGCQQHETFFFLKSKKYQLVK
jgi:hypothetical protein